MIVDSFKNSIIEKSIDPLDEFAPVSFLTWFNQKNFVVFDINELFVQYKNYIIAWGQAKKITKEQESDYIRDSYIQVLRDIVLYFSTEEEKRFIANADYTDAMDLDIILPFFINKLKNICLFYVNERENVKSAVIQHNLRGSNFGIENLVKKLIFDSASTSIIEYAPQTCRFPPVSAIANQIHVYVEELYDSYDKYYNINPLSSLTDNSTFFSSQLSSANLNQINPNLYLNFKHAIVDAINQYPFFIESLGTNNFTINPVLNGTELEYLKNRDFIDYLSGGENNLKINLYKKLAPKYLGSDFYYLSTGSTTNTFVSGIMFSVKPLSGAPTLNLLNRQFPSTASIPNLKHLLTEYEIGRFFTPQYSGLLIFNTPEKYPRINYSLLKPNTLYAFPDLNDIGNTSFNSETDNYLAPVVYEIDLTWNKVSRSNQFAFGDVLSDNYKQLYYGYQSQQQDLQVDVSGLSKTYDNVQFWTGEKQLEWANPDIWPSLQQVEILDISARQQSLLINNYTPVYWSSDIYGNEYGVLKNVNALQEHSSVPISQGMLPGSNTVFQSSPFLNRKSIHEKRRSLSGLLYVRNSKTGVSMPACDCGMLSAVFLKYPVAIREELENSIHYFNLYYNTFVAETTNYVVVDKISVDTDTGLVLPTNNPGKYFTKQILSDNLQGFVNEWYVEEEKTLYLGFLQLMPQLSASNYKIIYPVIYKTPLNELKFTQVYPSPFVDLNAVYSISAGFIDPPQIDLREIHGAHFSRFHKNYLFNFSYLAKNNNGMPLFYNEQFVPSSPYFTSLKPKIFKPFYYLYDNNYSNPILPYVVKYSGSTSGIMGAHNSNLFSVGQETSTGVTYLYSDGISPIQINNPGNYVINFDWQSYPDTNIFIGCSGVNIKNIDADIIWNNGTVNAQILNTYGQTITGLAFTVNDVDFVVYATRVTYPDPSILYLSVTTSLTSFTGVICDTPEIIYHNLSITKTGAGSGLVFSDPFCINCGSVCSENFALNSTLSLIASANYFSKFSQWIGGTCDGSTLADCIYTVTNTQNVTAVFDLLPIYRVMVFNLGGRVFSTDLNIDCPGLCSHYYVENTIVTLSSQAPVSGYEFRGYEGGPCSGETSNICSFFVTNNYDISAIYIRYFNYPLTINISPIASYGTVSASPLYDVVLQTPVTIECNSVCTVTLTGTPNSQYGSTAVSLTAAPFYGYNFVRWVGAPIDNITNNVVTFSMGSQYNVTALFELGNYTFTVIFSGDGLGTAFSSGLTNNFSYTAPYSGVEASFGVLNGTTFTINVTALSGSTLLGLYNNIYCSGPGTSSCNVDMTYDVTVIAVLTAGEWFTLNVIKTGTMCGGVTSLDGGINYGSTSQKTYPRNSTIYLGATATNPCVFNGFLGEGLNYNYQSGSGVEFKDDSNNTISSVILTYNEFLGSINTPTLKPVVFAPGSIGAPYQPGNGITITNYDSNAYIILTQNRTVSAEFS